MQQLDQTFRAIADPTRRAIIGLLADGDRTAGSVAAEFTISRPAIVKHLNILREGGLITTTQKGRERINRLNPAGFQHIARWVNHYERFWDDKLLALKKAAEKGKNK